jgi:hypothetical protein
VARHDLVCRRCFTVSEHNISALVGARAYSRETACARCGGELEPVPAIRLSLFSDADSRSSPSDFTKATVQMETPEGGFREVQVGSLRDIRRLERESEQAEKEGWGRRMCWRDYSNDRSNADVHTLGVDPSLRPAKRFTNGEPVVVRKGEPVTAQHGTIED